MSAITCPVCETSGEPATQVGAVAICAHCGASLVQEGDRNPARRATAADTTALSAEDLQTLRTSRKRKR